ncbi:hypothetical protein [Ramlibacter alkalitolerans]|uniref:Uncharacterized protein n=1 Tax=Ramlibacter alkalitolerans TaxID=2039631 RepID=A0ABS1JTP2_9BURK|nr:hypothetical protein [Ramlibacter alkalitolerans]MBL0427577.1 hypothetical protein [Ramlibacter alkalitolerans]
MAAQRTLARMDTIAWSLIYGGLFVLALGIASHGRTAIGGWSLGVLGGLATVAGVVLIVVRARLSREEPPRGRG